MGNFPSRKNIRLKNFDYNSHGVYFLTLCTKDRKKYLSEIIASKDKIGNILPKIHLSKYGDIAQQQIIKMNELYENISVENHVVMPDHIHLLIAITGNFENRKCQLRGNNENSIIAGFVRTFKRFTNQEYGFNMWQERYYDHVVRGEDDYCEIYKYIEENPIKRYFKK